MRPRLPPLNALKAFEAAARHESFTRAAEELCVTQGAVSHQVKALEAELTIKLFNRERQRLIITEAGTVREQRVTRTGGFTFRNEVLTPRVSTAPPNSGPVTGGALGRIWTFGL